MLEDLKLSAKEKLEIDPVRKANLDFRKDEITKIVAAATKMVRAKIMTVASKYGFIGLGIYVIILVVSALGWRFCEFEMCGILYELIPTWPWPLVADYFYELVMGPPPWSAHAFRSTFTLLTIPISITLNGIIFYWIGRKIGNKQVKQT